MNKVSINLQIQDKFTFCNKPFRLPLQREIFLFILSRLSVLNKELSVLFCSNVFIKKLNKDFRNKDEPTDVLSFPNAPFLNGPSFGQDNFLGDIAISLERAGEQAIENDVSFERELIFLMIHGILHLMGYDHERTSLEAQVMRDTELKVLKEVMDTFIC